MGAWYGSLPLFLGYLNSMDKTSNIKLTIKIASDTETEIFDLKLNLVEVEIGVDVFTKSANSL